MTVPRWWDSSGGAELLNWECAVTTPGGNPDHDDSRWLPARVPGTAAGAVRDAGDDVPAASARWAAAAEDPDEWDWWFRATLPPDCGDRSLLQLGGLATVADVWVDADLVLHSENMFVGHELVLSAAPGARLTIRCAALGPLLTIKRPRPPWRTKLLRHANLRWWRTTALGRMPALAPDRAPVGPWRPVSCRPLPPLRVTRRSFTVTGEPGRWRLDAEVQLADSSRGSGGASTARLVLTAADGSVLLEAPFPLQEGTGGAQAGGISVEVPGAAAWWPAGYGAQPLYGVAVHVSTNADNSHSRSAVVLQLGRIGFRTVDAGPVASGEAGPEPDGTGFGLTVNGVRVFARGVVLDPLDRVDLADDQERLAPFIELVVASGATVVRVPGTAVYPSDQLLDLLDERGLLLWQDLMVANLPPPDDELVVAELDRELEYLLGRLQGRPCLAVISGGTEVEQQAAMFGLPSSRGHSPVLVEHVPATLRAFGAGVGYVTSTPTGGEPPTRPDRGIAHWFGVGGYLMPLSAVRSAGVRFATECLALSNVPEPATVDDVPGGAAGAGHLPEWKVRVPRDNGASWDFEDVRDYYVRALHGTEPLLVRRSDPERALDLGRAVNTHLLERTFAEWRRPGSGCSGALVLSSHDQDLGAGWGLIDALGRPKSVWYAARRRWAPACVSIVDEGMAGLDVHLLNDGPNDLRAHLRLRLAAAANPSVNETAHDVLIPARGSLSLGVEALLGGFRDINHAYMFGSASYAAVEALLMDDAGVEISRDVHLVDGPGLPAQSQLGLSALAEPVGLGAWTISVRTDHLAEHVAIDLEDHHVQDSWFHLLPGRQRTLTAIPRRPGSVLSGTVRALNCPRGTAVEVAD